MARRDGRAIAYGGAPSFFPSPLGGEGRKKALATIGDLMTNHPALPYLRSAEKGKVVSAAEAVRLIRDGDTVATGGFVGIGFAEEIALALEEFYLASEGDAPYGQGKP